MQRILKVLIFNIALLLFFIFLLELFFGNWMDSTRFDQLNIPRNVHISNDISSLYTSLENIASYKRDKYGLRGSYASVEQIDILTVGGSTTDQRFLGEGKTWQDQLSKLFHEKNRQINIVNAGIDGQSTYGHIKNFEWWFPRIQGLNVQYILFYVGINDVYGFERPKFDTLLKTDEFSKLSLANSIQEKSIFYHLYRIIKGTLRAQQQFGKIPHHKVNRSSLQYTTRPLIDNYEKEIAKDLGSYRSRIKKLFSLSKSLDAKPIFVTQLSSAYSIIGGQVFGITKVRRYRDLLINGVDNYHILNAYNQAAMQVCKDMNGICIDLAKEIELTPEDFYDFEHTTPEGASKIAQFLYTKLKDVI